MENNFAYIHTAFWAVVLLVLLAWDKVRNQGWIAVFKHPMILYPIVALVGLPMGFLALILFFYWVMFVPIYILSGFDMESTRTMMENISNLHRDMLTK